MHAMPKLIILINLICRNQKLSSSINHQRTQVTISIVKHLKGPVSYCSGSTHVSSPLRLWEPGKPLTPAPSDCVRPVDTHTSDVLWLCPEPQHSVRLTPSQCPQQWYTGSLGVTMWAVELRQPQTPTCLLVYVMFEAWFWRPLAQDSFRSRELANLAWECFLHHFGMIGMSVSQTHIATSLTRNR